MNDLLAKPYNPAQLYTMVRKWCGTKSINDIGEKKSSDTGKKPTIYDADAALAFADGDADTAKLILEKFLELLPDSEIAIRTAHQKGDKADLYKAVHKLAGSAATCGATMIHTQASALQDLLKLEPFPAERIEEAVAKLVDQIMRLQLHFEEKRREAG